MWHVCVVPCHVILEFLDTVKRLDKRQELLDHLFVLGLGWIGVTFLKKAKEREERLFLQSKFGTKEAPNSTNSNPIGGSSGESEDGIPEVE